MKAEKRIKIKNITSEDRWLILSALGAIILSGTLACSVAAPAYKSNLSRTYESKLGYAALLRRQNKVFNVSLEKVKPYTFTELHLGEGLIASQPILVPVIPMTKVKKLYVEEGDFVKKGQLLLEMDQKFASIKLSSAELALKTASSELDRVSIGSAYILAQERPEKEKLEFNLSEKEFFLLADKLNRYKKLLKEGAISKDEFLEVELKYSEAEKKFKSSEFYLGMSTKGQKESLKIANNAVLEADNNLLHKNYEIENFKIYAPESGIVERVLIREGEYNQDSGRPAFVIASGLWFEAHVDQTAIHSVQEGNKAEVYLEAFSGRVLEGRVFQIKRIVSYNAGGPEINRPIRPRGSSAPEWPSTFVVRVDIEANEALKLYPGLTGFAKIKSNKKALSVNTKALSSLSSNAALLRKPSNESFKLVSVQTGISNNGKTEIIAGLTEGEEIISSGYEGLKEGDEIIYRP